MNSLMAYVDNYMFMNINGYNLRCSKTILNKRHIRQSCFNFVIHFCHLLVYSHMYISKNTLTNIHTSYGETKKHIAVTFNYRDSMVLIIITQDKPCIFSHLVLFVAKCYNSETVHLNKVLIVCDSIRNIVGSKYSLLLELSFNIYFYETILGHVVYQTFW